jgi:hypothetical protein
MCSLVMLPAQPNDGHRLVVIGMVAINLFIAADDAGFAVRQTAA